MARITILVSCLCVALAATAWAGEPDKDTDGDGLSDFRERHKHFTDPAKADSDGDGTPDGDWNERREYAYTIRTIVQVAPAGGLSAITDDYQDARLLDRQKSYVELEVIHYPFNTVAKAIKANPKWRDDAKRMEKWTRPGLTSNWDPAMRAEMIAALKKDGIDVEKLNDKTLVKKASKWLLDRAKYKDGFTTFCTHFPDGKTAEVFPGLKKAAESGVNEKGMSLEEQWDRELFAKGMFANKQRGSCTSSAIYLNGCLRALGIPTRVILTIPVADASDERELEMIKRRIKHNEVRRKLLSALKRLRNSWASHSWNEVYVGGRWRRLNYHDLGANIYGTQMYGMMTHVNTMSDWADANMAATWGLRQGSGKRSDDPFGFNNPYSMISISDLFGAHSKIKNPKPRGMKEVVIDSVVWSDSKQLSPDARKMFEQFGRPVVLLHVENFRGWESYKAFTENADGRFFLEADGHPTLKVGTGTGGFTMPVKGKKHCYAVLTLGGTDWKEFQPGVSYRLRPRNGDEPYAWVVKDSVRVTRDSK